MRPLLLLLLAFTAACETATGPHGYDTGTTTDSTTSPIVAPIDANYVPLMPGDTSFWAIKGQNTDVIIRFRPTTAGQTGDALAEFIIGGNSLLKRPDGTAIAVGDSVLITIRPDTTGHMALVFEPSGLAFDSTAPALLKLWCYHAAADLNGDGVVNTTDEQLWYEMAIWKRELPTDPWSKQSTTRSSDGYELDAPISGFTGFSVAS